MRHWGISLSEFASIFGPTARRVLKNAIKIPQSFSKTDKFQRSAEVSLEIEAPPRLWFPCA
jgi:hypothetical protein